jgi:hypothetical protein
MTETTLDLPSVQECRAFLDAINAERATGGLEPLQTLDFDGAEPDSLSNCLSARNCYTPLGYSVGSDAVYGLGLRSPRESPIPVEILRVTDVFDGTAYCTEGATVLVSLRARLVEAGVVKP